MAAPMQIFVYFGMSNTRTATFNVTRSTKVADFLADIVRKEGAEGVRVIFGGKQLEPRRNGKDLTLEDYGLYNGATCHAALRLQGGAAPKEGPTSVKFNEENVKKLGGTVVTKDCIYGIRDGCYESNVKKCELRCGCVYCGECMKVYINAQISVGLNVKIICGDTSHGNSELDPRLAYEIAGFSTAQKKEKDEILSKNFFKRNDSTVSVCPLNKCQMYVMRNGQSLKQQCDACHQFMCWNCKKEYKGKSQDLGCGNEHCDPVAYLTLLLAEAKLKDIQGKHVTDTRLCPKCYEIRVHNSACRHMTCHHHCKYQYCHICLREWKTCSQDWGHCTVAPEQKITKEMLQKK